MKRRRPPTRVAETTIETAQMDRVEQLIASARRLRRRGDERKARQVLAEACALDEWRPRTHALLGGWLLALRLHDEARVRLNHARWLSQRAGELGRVRTLDALLARAAERAA